MHCSIGCSARRFAMFRRAHERAGAVEAAADELRRSGRKPYVIPVGASTPLGAAAYALALGELLDQIDPPDVIVHSTSSGGTQAGLVAGCALAGVRTRVIGISADERADVLSADIRRIVAGSVRARRADARREVVVDVDDRFVGDGYGISTEASREALSLTARTEAIFLDPTYTAKAMAGLIAACSRAARSSRPRRCSSGIPAGRSPSSPRLEQPIARVARTGRRQENQCAADSLTFLGAARTVTGSKYLLDTGQCARPHRRRPVPGVERAARAELAGSAGPGLLARRRSC